MEKSLLQFIWRYSKRQQLMLLVVTLLTFPLLYASLELPKRIINDAIGGNGSDVMMFGVMLSQTQFLMLLCVCFLLTVLANGLLKMRLNTMKGVLAERLLRRFRFQLLTRMLRFPRPFFRTTSQGELVSMITSEAEPMGGLMGDAISQPVFQAGQMMTILVFLFAQSFWFGLASVALIPLQAWLIPLLQRQINLLNKSRIQEVRKLAADIGESAQGVSDLRINGGLRYQMALFSHRLGNLFIIRFQIYQKKFFMKFLNNFINQLTPFFFYSVGGFLAIQGQITVGALVAGLAAYKDLSSPWKELLAYYNQTQDMSLRWEIVIAKFAPKTLVDDALFEGMPDNIPDIKGVIELKDVTVMDEDGHTILEDINLTIPSGARVAIKTNNESAAMAFADLLTREVIPHRGQVKIAEYHLNELHQGVIANRVGYAHSNPHIFEGALGDNLLMPFKHEPSIGEGISEELALWQQEAARSGNSTDPLEMDWVDPNHFGFTDIEGIREWWFELVEAMGIDEFMVRRALRSQLEPGTQQDLAAAIVRLRPEIAKRLDAAGLDDIFFRFHPEKFNPVSPLGSNLLYAIRTRILTQETLSRDTNFIPLLRKEGIEAEICEMSVSLIDGLVAAFGSNATDHPLFRRLNIEDELYHRLQEIMVKRLEVGDAGLPEEDYALMLTVPFAFSAEQMGPAFSDKFKSKILQIRMHNAKQMVAKLDGLFETIDPERYIPVMTVLGNAIFGRISSMSGAREKLIEDIVVDVLSEHGLRRLAAQSIYDLVTGRSGQNLPAVFRERLAFSRAAIKKPDVLLLGNALASHNAEARSLMRDRISRLLPDATKIFIETHFNSPESYDLFVEIVDGRIDGAARMDVEQDASNREDLNQKLQVVAQAELFANLSIKQQRLLAYSAQWYHAKTNQVIFAHDQQADAAYLCVKGLAGLYWPIEGEESELIAQIEPGRLIGDLAVIMNDQRPMDLIAHKDSLFLRIGATELLAVIENDALVATSLLRSVAGHLMDAADNLRKLLIYAAEQGVDLSDMDAK